MEDTTTIGFRDQLYICTRCGHEVHANFYGRAPVCEGCLVTMVSAEFEPLLREVRQDLESITGERIGSVCIKE